VTFRRLLFARGRKFAADANKNGAAGKQFGRRPAPVPGYIVSLADLIAIPAAPAIKLVLAFTPSTTSTPRPPP